MARRKLSDPRRAGGSIAGPGGPHDRNAVIVDMSRAVLLDYCEVATVATGRKTPLGLEADVAISMMLGGRINKTDERAQILYLFDTDGAAAIITELFAVAARHGQQLVVDLNRRIEKLLADGNMEHRDDS